MNVNANARTIRIWYFFIIFFTVALMSVLSVHNGSFYDDEIFNLDHVQGAGIVAIWKDINSLDVHPPGSYVFNRVLLDLLGSWSAVKTAAGVLNALALAFFGFMAFDRLSPSSRWALAILLMGASTFVLWGASVRWYAFFNPIFTAALAVILFSRISVTSRTILLCVFSVLLLHISYAAFCAAPVLVAVHLLRERSNLTRRDWIILAAAGIVGILASLPQLYTFVHVHYQSKSEQVGSLFSTLSSVATTLLIGNSVFPLGVAPGLYALLAAALGLYFVLWKPKSQLDWIVLIALAVGALAMIATGLGVKQRNSVFLLPLVYLMIASSIGALPPILLRSALAAIALFQILGVTNVIAHRGTIKGSFDTDYHNALDAIQSWKSKCAGKLVVFNHDIVLAYLLDHAGVSQSSPYKSGGAAQDEQLKLSAGDCVVSAKTNRANLNAQVLSSHYADMNNAGLQEADAKRFSEDRNAGVKTWLTKETYPAYLISLQLYKVISPVVVPAWKFAPPGGFLDLRKR